MTRVVLQHEPIDNALQQAPRCSLFDAQYGDSPIVVLSIHSGHEVESRLQPLLRISEPERLREEDPFTDYWATAGANYVALKRSRFEVDLNRPPTGAVYRTADDAWGLEVWRVPLSEAVITRNMAEYRRFYAHLLTRLDELEALHGCFVVLDLHSYNHRRQGPDLPPAAARDNPEINIGTGSMDRRRWAPVVDRFLSDLRSFDFLGRQLDVRENVKFKGGYLSQWVHAHYPVTGCALAVEVKKFFMDEWTGWADAEQIKALREMIASTLPGIAEELGRL